MPTPAFAAPATATFSTILVADFKSVVGITARVKMQRPATTIPHSAKNFRDSAHGNSGRVCRPLDLQARIHHSLTLVSSQS
mmetsp:Transcript_118249/g.280720  ORF Transcript_118249/g.280720 Transcript_118249/m.280720 type:complete len:81 (-) Transcript_118249:319-561(-)